MAKNLSTQNQAIQISQLPWDSEHLSESLEKLYQFTVAEAQRSEDWYWKNSQQKKKWAQFLRVFTIVATALGGIIPIIVQIFGTLDKSWLSPAWASVLIALGATALGLDRFFGFSSGWIRFVTTALNIKAWISEFQYDCEIDRVAWKGQAPDYKQAQAAIVKSAAFAQKISTAVQEETRSWVEEFQNALKALDQELKDQATRVQPGALVINISNGDQCVDGWTCEIDDRRQEKHYGKSGVVKELYPGLYPLRISGKIKKKAVYAEAIAKLSANEITSVDLTLL